MTATGSMRNAAPAPATTAAPMSASVPVSIPAAIKSCVVRFRLLVLNVPVLIDSPRNRIDSLMTRLVGLWVVA